MFWSRAPRASVQAGRTLYASAAAQARRPEFYADFGVPDTANGRFEMYSLHVILLLNRLKGGGGRASETAQGLFDAFVGSLDDALREQGVGDLSMGKKMRKLGEAFYGRVKSYDAALEALPAETGELEALLARTVYDGTAGGAKALAAYAAAAREGLAGVPDEELLEARVRWPEPAP